MSKTNNEIRSALNLNEEEMYMLDDQQEWEAGQLEIDEKDLEAARLVLAAAIKEEKKLDEMQVNSPAIFNGVDWDKMAHLVEVQLFMRRVMARIEWIDNRLQSAKDGDYVSKEVWNNLIDEKKVLWSKWNSGKVLSQSIVGEEKKMWGVFFNIEDHEEFLRNHLEMDVSVWNTFGRDDEEDEGFDRFHVDVIDMLAQSHITEMSEYDRDVHVDWSFQDKRMNARIENESLEQQNLFSTCPF